MAEDELDEAKDAINELKKLSPEERIRRLKKLAKKDEERLKKEKELLKLAEAELEEEIRAKKQMPIPELKEVDITKLFQREEGLEGEVKKEKARFRAEEEAQVQYRTNLAQQLAEKPVDNIYKIMEGIYQGFQSTGYVSSDQMTVLNAALEASQEKYDSIKSGDYLASKEASSKLVASLSIAKFLQDRYKG